ncbi:MAG: hypothetical protein IPN84_17630 [Sphingomonadales bacterium]|nr:hypothetical protein [Sphingomonadales bacterium]
MSNAKKIEQITEKLSVECRLRRHRRASGQNPVWRAERGRHLRASCARAVSARSAAGRKIKSVLSRLRGGETDAAAFSAAITEAGAAIEDAEQRSLAEYIVRRKVVLDFIEILLEKVRDDTRGDSSYQREDTSIRSFAAAREHD